jgi:hypothetical protein
MQRNVIAAHRFLLIIRTGDSPMLDVYGESRQTFVLLENNALRPE